MDAQQPDDEAGSLARPGSGRERRHTVIVGVVPGQSDAVVREAAVFAERFGADLVCAFVDRGRNLAPGPDGAHLGLPIDPDLVDLGLDAGSTLDDLDPALAAHTRSLLSELGVRSRIRLLAGDPALALGRLAQELDADMIVVGTRDASVRATLQEFFSGSVAAHLAHRQHRPVVVVPLTPVDPDARLPWEGER
jgi:nucleotide-binding universal stress UspA family protein